MAGDMLHFAQAFFLELRISDGQNFVHPAKLIKLPRNLVCSPPNSQSPAGLPAAPFLRAAPALRFSLPHAENRAV
jgi:hypothetical protein